MATAAASENVQKELHKSKSGLRILTRLDSQSSPFLLDEPHWIPDDEVFKCQQCEKKFSFTNRKHHCRRCGLVFCSKDVNQTLPLPRLSFVDPVRLCGSCATITRKENEFFDKHIKTLTTGATFNVTSTAHNDPEEERQFHCKLTPSSHRYIEFQSNSVTHDNIDISAVSKLQILAVGSDTGSAMANGLSLVYKDFSDNIQTVTLRAKTDNSKKLAAIWIVAMQKAMKLLFDGKTAAVSSP